MWHVAIALAACVLVAQVAGNNLPACVGAIISSRIVSRRAGVWIAIAGYTAGLGVEGGALRPAFAKLMPNSTYALILAALASGIAIFIVAHLRRVPHSLSQTFACIILGSTVARHAAVAGMFVAMMLLFWICAPLAAIGLNVVLIRASKRILHARNVWGTLRKIKASLLFLSFFAAFALGANTIGFIYAAVPYDPRTAGLIVLAIIIGATCFSRGELRRVSNEIVTMRYTNSIVAQFSAIVLLETATLLGVPLSYTVVFTSGVYGASFGYQHRLLAANAARTIAYAWLAMLTLGFLLGYLTTMALVHASTG